MEKTYNDAFTFKCCECDARYTTQYKKSIHKMKVHLECDDPFRCAYCLKRCKTSEQLRRHRKRHTIRKKFRCPYCFVWFSSKSATIVHKKTSCINRNFILSQELVNSENLNQQQQVQQEEEKT